METSKIRQPIVTVVGHVDHGKTSILDSIRSTAVASKEAGGITQKISSTPFPAKILEEKCKHLLEKYKIKITIPGFLFIDTPGHAAFINLRKRGGSLADLAILVIDINEGIMPQTAECIEILKANKTPFIIALNKIDAISGWQKLDDDLEKSISKQPNYAKKDFDSKLYKIIASLATYGFDSDIFFRINDFSRQLALVPCSGKKGEGITELLVMLSGLSQRFLAGKLVLHEEPKGTILEVKREKNMLYLEAILYDGILSINDDIVVAGLEKPIATKVRALFEALPLGYGFKAAKKVKAAAGIRIQVPEAAEILPGMPFIASKNVEEAAKIIQKEVSDTIILDEEGIIIKADSLGSLEALLMLLKKQNIKIRKAGIGNIGKTDIVAAESSLETNPLDAVILGFNVSINEDAQGEKNVKVLMNDIIYRLIENFEKWRKEKQTGIEGEKLESVVLPCKLKVLRFMFRQSKPAIFGVKIEAGTLKAKIQLMNEQGEKIDEVKAMQSEGKSIEKAGKGKEIAISLPKITYGRQIKEHDILYSDMNEDDFQALKENKKLLNADEIALLQEIAAIKRKTKATWGL